MPIRGSLGVALLDRSSPSPGRWRPAPRRSSSTCTPHRTASWSSATTPPLTARRRQRGTSPASPWPNCGSSTSRTGSFPEPTSRPDRPEGEYPYRGRAPEDPQFGIATLREVLEQFPGVVLNLDIKQTAPVVTPYEESLARLLAEFERTRRRHCGLVPRPGHRRLPDVCARGADLGGNGGHGRVLAGGARRRAASRQPRRGLPGTRAHGRSRRGRRGVRRGRPCSGKAVHVWTVNEAAAMERLVGLGVDGIISDVPTMLSTCSGRRVSPGTGG